MKNSKHTPGPWKLMPNSQNSTAVYATVRAHPLTDSAETCLSLVASCRISHDDANLIAAAPEMLEALENMQDLISSNASTAELLSALRICNEAIAKARGERAGK